jgi:hypothetical protein
VGDVPWGGEVNDSVKLIVDNVDLDSCIELALQLTNEHSDWHGDDGLDYFRAATYCLAELVCFRRDFDEEGFRAFLSEHPQEWLASDGDVRFNLSAILSDGVAQVWEKYIEESMV